VNTSQKRRRRDADIRSAAAAAAAAARRSVTIGGGGVSKMAAAAVARRRRRTALLSHLCGLGCSSLRFYKHFCRRMTAVVLKKVAEGLRLDCGQHGFLTVFRGISGGFLRFSASA